MFEDLAGIGEPSVVPFSAAMSAKPSSMSCATLVRWIGMPLVALRPCLIHCHSCAREVSAVAASSMRLSIAAAPMPVSHDSM